MYRVALSRGSLPDPCTIPKELVGILGKPQVYNISDGNHEKEDQALDVELKSSEAPKQEATSDLLPSALRAAIGKTDDDKPKAKEAETVKLYPISPIQTDAYRSWKIAVLDRITPQRSKASLRESWSFMPTAKWSPCAHCVSSMMSAAPVHSDIALHTPEARRIDL